MAYHRRFGSGKFRIASPSKSGLAFSDVTAVEILSLSAHFYIIRTNRTLRSMNVIKKLKSEVVFDEGVV